MTGKRDDLTPLEDRLALRIAQGDAAISAYRFANPESVEWDDADVFQHAAAIMSRARFKARLREYEAAQVPSARRTLPEHVRQLERLRDMAIGQGEVNHAIKAEELIGKVSGLYVEKKEVTGANNGPLTITIKKQVIDVIDDLI